MENKPKEKFLLHACCAPCGAAVIDELRQNFALTVFFYNPNIYPVGEYNKRKAEIVKVCREWNVPIIDGDYNAAKWATAVKGLEKEPEGGARCAQCFLLRFKETAKLAKELDCRHFGSTLTMGRFKKAEIINPIGRATGNLFGVNFYEQDWKKGGRYEKRNSLVKEKRLYVQNYCGCIYSLKESIKRRRKALSKK